MKGKRAACSPTTYTNGIIILSLLGAIPPIEFFIRALFNKLADGSNETSNAVLISLETEEMSWICRFVIGFATSVTVAVVLGML